MDVSRKRALFRATHRGTLEADRLLGGFAEARLAALDAGQLARFEALLDENDIDILTWLNGLRPVPADLDHDVMAMLIAYKDTL